MSKKIIIIFAFIIYNLSFTIHNSNAQTTILFEDFECDSLPAGWAIKTKAGDGGWKFGITDSLSTPKFGVPAHTIFAMTNDATYDYNKSADYLITPSLDLSAYTFVRLKADIIFIEGYYGDGSREEFKVMASTNDGVSWTEVYRYVQQLSWGGPIVDLSSYAGDTAVKFAFKYSDDLSHMLGAAVDDVHIFEPADEEAELSSISAKTYIGPGVYEVTGEIKNNGTQSITSIDLNWSINDSIGHTQTVSGLNISPSESSSFTHPDPMIVTTYAQCTLKVWISNPNGNTDSDTTNNTLSDDFIVLSKVPVKKVLIEQGSDIHCNYCTDADVIMDSILKYNPNTIGVTIHGDDVMEIPDGLEILNTFFSNLPAGMIDRTYYTGENYIVISRNQWIEKVAEELTRVVPVSVSISSSFNDATRLATIDVSAEFYGPYEGDLRINCYLVENHFYGHGPAYYQDNFSNTIPGHPMNGRGNPITDYEFNNLLRDVMGGPEGVEDIIDSTATDGSVFTHQFKKIIPAAWDEKNISVIAFVQEISNNMNIREFRILNAEEVPLGETTGISIFSDNDKGLNMDIYPNPFSNNTSIKFEISKNDYVKLSIHDIKGQLIEILTDKKMEAGSHQINFNAENMARGMYLLHLQTENSIFVKKLMVQ